MATQHARSTARLMMAPAVVLLLGWMLVPLTMTLYFSFKKYLPLRGGDLGWVWFDNYARFVTSSAFWPSIKATLAIVGGVLVITVVFGVLLALLLNRPIWGQGAVRVLVIAPGTSFCGCFRPRCCLRLPYFIRSIFFSFKWGFWTRTSG